MVKVTVLYGHPTDPNAFETYYAEKHIPLALKMPGVARIEAATLLPQPDGSKSSYYRIAELWFSDMQQLQATLGSPEGRAVTEDLANFATGGATMFTSDVNAAHGQL